MDEIRFDVVEQALVVGYHDHRAFRTAQCVDAIGDDTQRINVESGVGLVKNRQGGLQQCHLKCFISFFLAAGKTAVDITLQQTIGQFDLL